MRRFRGMTLLEVLLAVFLFGIGIIGVLGALMAGVEAGTYIILQDASIHLAESKFAEFRRDHADPTTELVDGSPYMNGHQEPLNSSGAYHDFAHGVGERYQYFDDIERYEWKVTVGPASFADPVTYKTQGLALPVPVKDLATGYSVPYFLPTDSAAGPDFGVRSVRVTVHLKSTSKEFGFTQYMCSYESGAGP